MSNAGDGAGALPATPTAHRFEVAICTRNRGELLRVCLDSLAEEMNGRPIRVILVDNGSTDGTRELAAEFSGVFDLVYVHEAVAGLSRARNAALAACRAEFIVFLDDDAKPLPGWIDAIDRGIAQYDPDFFGGPYMPFYLTERPRWFLDAFGSMHLEKHEGLLEEKQFVSGGNMGWRLQLIRELGGFPENLGMIGSRLGIGEETYLQRLCRRDRGAKGYFLKAMAMLHYVPPEKMSLVYRARRLWMTGYQEQEVNLGKRRFGLRSVVYECAVIPWLMSGFVIRNRRELPYWQCHVFQRVLPHLRFWGEVCYTIKSLFTGVAGR